MRGCFDEDEDDENRGGDIINKQNKNKYKRNVIINIKEIVKMKMKIKKKIKEIMGKIWFVSEREKYLLTLPLVV